MRDASAANEAIRKAWTESEGLTNYVGEWHTHPADYPVPSRRDRKTMEDLVASGQIVTDFLILILVGRKAVWTGVWYSDGSVTAAIEWECTKMPCEHW